VSVPLTFMNDPFSFMKVVSFFEGDNFLLLPTGGNRVSLIHNCFKADLEDDSGVSAVFGILGSRNTSPFKKVNIGQAIMHQTAPRVTRSEERKKHGRLQRKSARAPTDLVIFVLGARR
jgi:hypothetical protein